MERLTDTIAYWLAGLLIFVCEHVPLATSLRIGDFFGKAVFYCSKKRRVAYINLKNALGTKLTPAQRWQAVRTHYGSIGQNVIEVMSFRKLTRAHIEKHVTINHLERFQELVKSGRGGVLLTGHFGNWELLQVVAGLLGTPIHVLARDQKFPRLNELLNQLRETHGSVAVSRGAGLRALIRALREGKLIGVLGDQSAGKTDGILLPFFGRTTSVPVGAFELAIRTKALVMPCFMVRRGGADHEIFVGKVLEDDPARHNDERVRSLAAQYISALEEFIGQHPDQWLWENKRWKYSWDRKILILSDGKAGHFKQSDVVAEILAEYKEFHGRPGLKFTTDKILIEYRSGFHRALLAALAPFLRPFIQGRLSWLRPFLKEESQKAVENATADFIIAAGSSLAPVQQLLARETGAKTVVIMKPPFPYSVTRYDLAVVPAHDGGLMPKGNFRCVIMPSGYQKKDRSRDADELKAKTGGGNAGIAVFVGGTAHHFDITVRDAEKLAGALIRASKKAGGYMLTTSRRTSKPVEQFLKGALGRDAACRLLVIANEENPSYAAGGMLEIADLLIVTEDSLAMISEAVGTGKKVIVLKLGEGELPAKHYRFHQILEQRGLVTVSGLDDLEKNITELMGKPAAPAVQRERGALAQKLGELL
jgi:KDO2-lipid IV(A) lauroyltransferase